MNIILATDSYKSNHFLQYPPKTSKIYSYIESRGGNYPHTLFFGLQMFIQKFLLRSFTKEHIDEAEEILTAHGNYFNREGWEYILYNHKGYLPLEIRAYKEGSIVPVHTPLVTVVNTDDNCAWLTSYIETALLQNIWYPTTVATNSYYMRNRIKYAMEFSGSDMTGLPFKLHDFGVRGTSSMESAESGGLAHLVSFLGTDNIPAILAGRKYYDEPMAGYSIPASEHSTITSWGSTNDEETAAYENMIDKFAGPGNLYACVSDSYDLDNAVNHIWGETFRDKVISSGGTLVVRPDSGDPVTVPIEVIENLGKHFGFTYNERYFRVLHPSVRVIQGDGINKTSLSEILANMLAHGLSIDNIAFGMGSGLLQDVRRDDQKFAMKASAIEVDGVWKDVFKSPKGDQNKTSKRGRFLEDNNLEVVYRNGEMKRYQTFAEIRKLAGTF